MEIDSLCGQLSTMELDDQYSYKNQVMEMLSADLDLLAYDYCILGEVDHLILGTDLGWDFYFDQGIDKNVAAWLYKNDKGYRWLVDKILGIRPQINIDHMLVKKYLDAYIDGFVEWHG